MTLNKNIYKTVLLQLAILSSAAISAQPRGFGEAVADSMKTEDVYLPLNGTVRRLSTTSGSRSISGSTLEKVPTFDFYNSLTGMIPGLIITENSGTVGMRFSSATIGMNGRGFTPVVIVDDVTMLDFTEMQLNAEEVESVTYVSDIVDKLKYGPEAANGAIYIRTLRGTTGKRIINAGFEKGIDVIDRMPEYCNAVEYAQLNNLARKNYNELPGVTTTYPLQFTDADIQAFAQNNPYDFDHPAVDYKSRLLKNTKAYNKAYVLIRGGNSSLSYSGNVGWVNSGDIYNSEVIGYTGNYNRFNAKMNIDITVNPRLKANVSFFGTYSMRKSPGIYGNWNLAQDFNTLIQYINQTPPQEFPLQIGFDEEKNKTIYASTTEYPFNPYAMIVDTGGYTDSYRYGLTKASLDYDLSSILKNLKSETQISYKVAHSNRIGQGASNIIMLFNKNDRSTEITSYQGQRESSASMRSNSYIQTMQFHEKLYHNLRAGNHSLNTSLVYYYSKLELSSSSSYRIQQNGIFSANYGFKNRYILDVAANYSGSSSLKKGNRYTLFPSVGLAWNATEESFLSDIPWLNLLRFRGQWGIMGAERYGDQYLWESYYAKGTGPTYGPYSTAQWFGSTSASSATSLVNRVSNAGLDWEKHREMTAGFDAVLFKKLDIGLSYYNILQYDVVQAVTSVLPAFLGATAMYDNYGANRYWGTEFRINWSDSKGDFKYSVGGSAVNMNGRYEKYLQTTTYDNLIRKGTSVYAIWGYNYIGRFKDQADIDNSPRQTFDNNVYPGDFKYEDITGDGVVDTNDQTIIGNSMPKLRYSVNLYLAYRNWEFSATGTGHAFYDGILANNVYRGAGGNSNYSKWMKNAVETGFYPRFTYIDSNNNNQASQFWKTGFGYFKVQDVELARTFNLKEGNAVGIRNLRVFVRGANLLTISGIKDIDPEATNSGLSTYPLFKTFTAGLKVTF